MYLPITSYYEGSQSYNLNDSTNMPISSKKQNNKTNKLFFISLVIFLSHSAAASDDTSFIWENIHSFSIFMTVNIGVYAYLSRFGISHFVEFKEALLGNYDAERESCYKLMKNHRASRVVGMPNFYTQYMQVDNEGRPSASNISRNYYLYPTSLELMSLPLEIDQKVYNSVQKHYSAIYKIEMNKYNKKSKKKITFEKTKQFEKFSISWRSNLEEIYSTCLFFYNNSSLFYQCVKSIYQSLPMKQYWNSIIVYRNQNSSSWPDFRDTFRGLAPVFYIDSKNKLRLDRWIFVESAFNSSCGLTLQHSAINLRQ